MSVSKEQEPRSSRVRVTRLKTLDDVRLELAKVYREARTKKLDMVEAKGLAYLLSVMSTLVKETLLEERIRRLEETMTKPAVSKT